MLCKYCNKNYPKSNFEVANIINGKVYRRLKCKGCKQNRQKERRHEAADWLNEYKKTKSCKECGFSDYRGLCFHHRNSVKKEFTIGEYLGASIKKIMVEVKKCEVLCFNCHMILHAKERELDQR